MYRPVPPDGHDATLFDDVRNDALLLQCPAESKTRDATADNQNPRRAAIVTRSGSESAFILRITWPRCAFTVISLIPSGRPAY